MRIMVLLVFLRLHVRTAYLQQHHQKRSNVFFLLDIFENDMYGSSFGIISSLV